MNKITLLKLSLVFVCTIVAFAATSRFASSSIRVTIPVSDDTVDSTGRILMVEGEIATEEEVAEEEENQSFAFLFLLCLEIFCFFVAFLLKQTHFKYIQEAGATMLFGAIVGGFIRFASNVKKLQSVVTFDAEVFFLFLLPPIIFESGYNMKRRNFFKNIDGIIMYAFFGTTIATFVTGLLLYWVNSWGIMDTQLSFLECLLFGSLISATDPVTVLAIFKELKVDTDMYSLVFGESVLNDAVAIVLYRTVLVFAVKPFSFGTVMSGVGSFLVIFLGSLACGVAIALLSALVYKHTELNKHPTLETSLLVLFAYSSYLLSEGLHLSGIVAILFCGIVMAHYTYNNLSKESQEQTANLFSTVALLTETLVFVYLGLALFSFESAFDFVFIFMAIIIILIARAAQVFPLSWLINVFRPNERKISMRYQIFTWFAGLRGGIAFALALSLHSSTVFPAGTAIFTTTLMIAFFTVLALGGVTVPLLEKLEIPIGVEGDEAPSAPSNKPEKFTSFDRKYFKPFFTHARGQGYKPQRDEDENVEMSSIHH